MHAHTLEIVASAPLTPSSLVPVGSIKNGQPFIRLDSPSEVLALLSFAGGAAEDTTYAWAVVLNVNHDSEGYVPGQLLKLRRTSHVRLVHEVHAPVYSLEH